MFEIASKKEFSETAYNPGIFLIIFQDEFTEIFKQKVAQSGLTLLGFFFLKKHKNPNKQPPKASEKTPLASVTYLRIIIRIHIRHIDHTIFKLHLYQKIIPHTRINHIITTPMKADDLLAFIEWFGLEGML